MLKVKRPFGVRKPFPESRPIFGRSEPPDPFPGPRFASVPPEGGCLTVLERYHVRIAFVHLENVVVGDELRRGLGGGHADCQLGRILRGLGAAARVLGVFVVAVAAADEGRAPHSQHRDHGYRHDGHSGHDRYGHPDERAHRRQQPDRRRRSCNGKTGPLISPGNCVLSLFSPQLTPCTNAHYVWT